MAGNRALAKIKTRARRPRSEEKTHAKARRREEKEAVAERQPRLWGAPGVAAESSRLRAFA
jgi:hypothetical protein